MLRLGVAALYFIQASHAWALEIPLMTHGSQCKGTLPPVSHGHDTLASQFVADRGLDLRSRIVQGTPGRGSSA
jgi:hypothetical protein